MDSDSAVTASSNKDHMMSAEAPASSNSFAMSMLRESGEAEGTRGFFSSMPR